MADLTENSASNNGSIANAIAGKYDFSIEAIISEAWAKTKGSKGTVWLALLFYLIVFIPVSIGANFLLAKFGITLVPGDPARKFFIYIACKHLIKILITLPLAAGLFMVGLKLAMRAPVRAAEVFGYYHKFLPLLGLVALEYLMIMVGLCLLIIPGIYLAIAYAFAMPLVIEKNLSPWEAMETSRKAITHHWFKVFGLYFVVGLILVLSMIPLGIGLIWTLPMLMLSVGVLYRTIFGYEGNVHQVPPDGRRRNRTPSQTRRSVGR